MKRVYLITVIAAAFILSAVSVYSQPGPEGRGGSKERLHEKLNLTQQQEEKIESLRSVHQKKMIDLKADLQKAKVDAKALRNKDNVSRSEVISSVEKINEIKNKMALQVANHRMDVYELLTPDQKKIWKENQGNREHKMGMRDRIKKHFRQ